jgi:hypothetical protein
LPGEHGKPTPASSPSAVLRLQRRAWKRLGCQREHPPSEKRLDMDSPHVGRDRRSLPVILDFASPLRRREGKLLLALSNSFPKLSDSSTPPAKAKSG